MVLVEKEKYLHRSEFDWRECTGNVWHLGVAVIAMMLSIVATTYEMP